MTGLLAGILALLNLLPLPGLDGVHLVRREQALSSYTSEAVAIFLPQSAKQIYRGDLGRNRHEWTNRANFSDVLS